MSTEAYTRILANFALDVGASQQKHNLLLQDQAGWHTSKRLGAPLGIELINLPPYSPELQPAERLWRLTDDQRKSLWNEPLVNRSFDNLDPLQDLLDQRRAYLMPQPDLISQETLYHWWPLV